MSSNTGANFDTKKLFSEMQSELQRQQALIDNIAQDLARSKQTVLQNEIDIRDKIIPALSANAEPQIEGDSSKGTSATHRAVNGDGGAVKFGSLKTNRVGIINVAMEEDHSEKGNPL